MSSLIRFYSSFSIDYEESPYMLYIISAYYWYCTQSGKKFSPCDYEQKMKQQGLVNVKSLDPSIAVLLKYSTTDNFVKKDVYGCMTACYLQKSQLKCWQRQRHFEKNIQTIVYWYMTADDLLQFKKFLE
jgi:hypothetical protein